MKHQNILLGSVLALVFPQAFAQAPPPSDAQIAAIVVTANQVDIEAGKLARSRSHNQSVKTLANQMVVDHTAVNKSATDLATKLHLTPVTNATSDGLKQGGTDNMKHLKSLRGAEFDHAYVDNEVTYHQSVIDALDLTLLPNAKNEELKSLLANVRPAFVAHLQHAKEIQASMR